MRLWLLRPVEPTPAPWSSHGYGWLWEVVVRADSEESARRLAMGRDAHVDLYNAGEAWLDPAKVTCEELTAAGEPGVIVADVYEP